VNRGGSQNNVEQPGPVLEYHFATLGEPDALAEGRSLVLVSVPPPGSFSEEVPLNWNKGLVLPLALLFFTGSCLFLLPYAAE
jgi:hypothetical protein